MPTSSADGGILFIGGPKDGQRIGVAPPLPPTIAVLREDPFRSVYSSEEDLFATPDNTITYEKRFFRVSGMEHLAYVLRGMSSEDAAGRLSNILYLSSSLGLAASQAPVCPEFLLQSVTRSNETRVVQDVEGNFYSALSGPSVQAELISPIPSSEARVNTEDLVRHMTGKRMTIGGFEGVVVACSMSAPRYDFPMTSVTLREMANMEDYTSTGIVVAGVVDSSCNANSDTEGFPVVPLRKPGEAPKLRRIVLPK